MKKSFSYAPNPFKKMPRSVKKLAVANAIYVTNTDKDGNKISLKEFKRRTDEVEKKFIYFFGGITNDEINHGHFKSAKNKILTEKVARIASFAEAKVFRKHRKELESWILTKKKEWNQEAIAYEFEGDLYYI
jgi:hypothetical protein